MKILRVSPSYYPAFKLGGPILADYIIDKCLLDLDNNVHVITTKAGIESNVNYLKNVSYFRYSFGTNFSFSLRMFMSIITNIPKNDLVFVTGVWNFSSIVTPFICKLFNIPYIYIPHGSLYRDKINKKKTFIKTFIFEVFIKFILKNAKIIQIATFDERKGLEEIYGRGIEELDFIRLPIPVDIGSIDSDEYICSGNKKIKLLFVGRINYIKGLDILIRAFSEVRKKVDNIELHLVGYDDCYIEELRNISNFEHNDIIYHGGFKHNELKKFYEMADVFIMPSYSENYSMVVAEAAFFGKALLLSKKVGISEFFLHDKSAIIFEPTVDDCFDAIVNIINNPSLIRNLGENAKMIANKEFTIDKSKTLIANLIDKVGL
ncbi:glycosyltransferase family 4 protein [Photobacterium damselae]|nr:glycosyltransferase family 4 protein [Photobacterium damselae]